MTKSRAFCSIVLLNTLLCVPYAYAQSSNGFRWISRQRDSALWHSIEKAFRSQLKPSHIPEGDIHGYLRRVGIFGDSVLVIVAYQVGNYPKDGSEYASAFNYDTTTRSISKITGLDYMWFWEFTKLARFEPSPAPDVVFTYDDCEGCEANEILASLRYDPAARQWQIRRWKGLKDWTTDTGLIVESAPEPDDPLIADDNLYGLIDPNGNGFDDVALRSRWVRKTAQHQQHVDDWTLLYGTKNGAFVGRVVSDKGEQRKIWSKLCVNSRNKLCKDVSGTK